MLWGNAAGGCQAVKGWSAGGRAAGRLGGSAAAGRSSRVKHQDQELPGEGRGGTGGGPRPSPEAAVEGELWESGAERNSRCKSKALREITPRATRLDHASDRVAEEQGVNPDQEGGTSTGVRNRCGRSVVQRGANKTHCLWAGCCRAPGSPASPMLQRFSCLKHIWKSALPRPVARFHPDELAAECTN